MIIYAENSPYWFIIAPLPSLPIGVFLHVLHSTAQLETIVVTSVKMDN